MIRLFVEHPLEKGVRFSLGEKQAHYVMHVMRVKEGQSILIFNGKDGLFEGVLAGVGKKGCDVSVLKQIEKQPIEEGVDLYFSMVKKEAMEWIIEKATELGVQNLHPVISARSVVHKMNRERMKLIAAEAAEQSERLNVPEVYEPVEFKRMLAEWPKDTKLVYLNERGAFEGVLERGAKMAFLVGPEGGFTPDELKALGEMSNAISVNLGKQILRAETACVAVLACARFKMFIGD